MATTTKSASTTKTVAKPTAKSETAKPVEAPTEKVWTNADEAPSHAYLIAKGERSLDPLKFRGTADHGKVMRSDRESAHLFKVGSHTIGRKWVTVFDDEGVNQMKIDVAHLPVKVIEAMRAEVAKAEAEATDEG